MPPDYMQSFKIQLPPELTNDLNKHIDQILKQRQANLLESTKTIDISAY